jgi:CRISPR-associated protein Cas2
MFVIMSYDISEQRVAKARKIAKKYLMPVQRSLFQGYLTEKQLEKLKTELSQLIIPESDKVVFYKVHNDCTLKIDEIGIINDFEMIL